MQLVMKRIFQSGWTGLWWLAFGLSVPKVGLALEGNEPADRLRLLERGICEVYEKAAPAVVVVEVEVRKELPEIEMDPAPDGVGRRSAAGGTPGGGSIASAEVSAAPEATAKSEGSGFVVRDNGVILTNYHVVSKALRISVRLRDGRRLSAKVLGADERTDVAALQVDAKGLPVLAFADSASVRVGQWVGAIGAPFSQEWSFTSGMVSGKGRSRLLGPGSAVPLLEDYLQTDALISPGHSGGPLLDLDGRVIGMNTLITRMERGLAFAVPAHMLQQALGQILAQGRVSHPWLGIRVETLGDTAALAERLAGAGAGVVVIAVEPDGPGFRTDLRPADVIQKIDGVSVQSAMDLQRELFSKKVGVPVQLSLWRPAGVKTLTIQTMEVPEQTLRKPLESLVAPGKETQNDRFGLVLKDAKPRGVRVEAVEPDSVAWKAEMMVGDLITDVEGRQVRSALECHAAIRTALLKGGGGAVLQIERQGRRTFALLKAR